MTRFPWFPLLLFALGVCLVLAYARLEAQADAEWQRTMDAISRQMTKRGEMRVRMVDK